MTNFMQTIVVAILCVLAIALSLKSMLVLGSNAPWTSAGWGLTVVYLVAVIAKDGFGHAMPHHGEYVVLVGLTVAFVIAGIRDERQAEPWWWPTRRGASRAEKRRAA